MVKRKKKVKYNAIKELERQYYRLCGAEKLSPGQYFEQITELKVQIKH